MCIAWTQMEQDQIGHCSPARLILFLWGTNAHPLRRQPQSWMITIQSHAVLLLPGKRWHHSSIFSSFAVGEAAPLEASQTILQLFPTQGHARSLSGFHRV